MRHPYRYTLESRALSAHSDDFIALLEMARRIADPLTIVCADGRVLATRRTWPGAMDGAS